MKKREPNHICQNPYCKNGIDGKPKHYYACDYCDRITTYLAYTCSKECWMEFCDVNNGKKALPKRTDKTQDEVEKIYELPIEVVKEETLNDLSDMEEVIKEVGLQGAIEEINTKISKSTKRTRKK